MNYFESFSIAIGRPYFEHFVIVIDLATSVGHEI
ncbi:Uncharacterised protein [Klebsiella michiganensis]|uniref:Uncharacterized protein n=1 Tax=Klebsiella michiganensis TaxID=1134687 RepID=A0A7H4MTN5_9ENTR|nr:Uncharacterised protein [Klebsiella michiganensis]